MIRKLTLTLLLSAAASLHAQGPRYDLGSPVLKDLWVDAESGSDERDGLTRATAVQTLGAAWRLIPNGTLTGTGYRIRLAPGVYRGAYLEDRTGTAAFPILIEPADGPGTVTFGPIGGNGGNVTVFGSSYVYLQDLRIATPGGDGFQCERCDHVLLRRMTVRGQRTDGQDERVKVNQSQHVYLEDSEVSGAGDNAIDMVGVQYGHIVRSRIHDSTDWCLYLKGGSAYYHVEANEVFDCGTGGFTAGQGSGFQFMVSPWLHYETYDTRFVNNVIHDTWGAGMGVNGGYDILMAHNTMYRVGTRSHTLELVFGSRSCDGVEGAPGREVCGQYRQAGGWGGTAVDDGTNFVRIPNRNVFVYDNLLYNPAGTVSSQQLEIPGPVSGATQTGTNVPVPTRTDDNLQIRGNVLANGTPETPLGVDEGTGCQPSNPSCNASQLRAENAIATLEPQLVAPDAGDFRPVRGGNVTTARTFPIPAFPGGDRPERPATPAGELANAVATDATGLARTGTPVPGAFLPSDRTFTSALFVPIVLSSSGANGAFFTSELVLTNRGSLPAAVRYTYTAAPGSAGGSGTGTDTLAAGGQKVVPDAIEYLRSRGVPLPAAGSRFGTLRVELSGLASKGDGAVTVRTTTAVASGRAGLAYAGLPLSRLLRHTAFVCGLRQNETDRSNVAILNAGEPGQGDVVLRVTVVSGDADHPGSIVLPEETLSPGGFKQFSGVLSEAGFGSGFVRVERVSGTAPFYAYGVINDQATSDGSFVPPAPAHALVGRTDVTIPVVVEAGAFTSEVVLTNTSSETRTLTLRYVADAIQSPTKAAEVTQTLRPREQVVLPGFVKMLRDLGAPGVGGGAFAGALFVSVAEGDLSGVVVGARTAAAGGGGSFGLFYGAVPRGAGAIGVAHVYALQQNAENRTNLALVNTGERTNEDSVFRVEIVDGDTGRLVGSLEDASTTVPARGFKQLGAVLDLIAPGTRNAWARVTRLTGSNPFVTYAVINDGGLPGQRSGDGAFVAMDGGEYLD